MAILFNELGRVEALPTRVKIQSKKDIKKEKKQTANAVEQPTFPSDALASRGHFGGGAIMRFNSTLNHLMKRRSNGQTAKGGLRPNKSSK